MSLPTYPDSRPISAEDRTLILDPFILAAQMTLSELAGVEPIVRSLYRIQGPRALADHSAVIAVIPDDRGVLVLSFPSSTATALARRVLAQAVPDPDDLLIRDCLGELANVTAGQAKTLLAHTPFQLVLGTPSVLSHADAHLGIDPVADSLVVVLDTELGELALQICLDRPTNRSCDQV